MDTESGDNIMYLSMNILLLFFKTQETFNIWDRGWEGAKEQSTYWHQNRLI